MTFSFLFANTFGVPNGAALIIYDNHTLLQTLTTACDKHPGYANYCFHPGSNDEGDYVTVIVQGYHIKNANDVSKYNQS